MVDGRISFIRITLILVLRCSLFTESEIAARMNRATGQLARAVHVKAVTAAW